MDELIKTFHIDWKLLIAQIINFGIVIAVLGIFAVKPLLKLMKERTATIKKGVDDAQKAEENLQHSEKLKQEKVSKGRKEASEIIEKAEKESESLRQEKIEITKAEAAKVVAQAKEKISTEKQQVSSELKKEMNNLVVMALDKVSDKAIDTKTHKKIIDQAIEEVKNI